MRMYTLIETYEVIIQHSKNEKWDMNQSAYLSTRLIRVLNIKLISFQFKKLILWPSVYTYTFNVYIAKRLYLKTKRIVNIFLNYLRQNENQNFPLGGKIKTLYTTLLLYQFCNI